MIWRIFLCQTCQKVLSIFSFLICQLNFESSNTYPDSLNEVRTMKNYSVNHRWYHCNFEVRFNTSGLRATIGIGTTEKGLSKASGTEEKIFSFQDPIFTISPSTLSCKLDRCARHGERLRETQQEEVSPSNCPLLMTENRNCLSCLCIWLPLEFFVLIWLKVLVNLTECTRKFHHSILHY